MTNSLHCDILTTDRKERIECPLYYLLLNLVPVDYILAKSQVDMYLSGQRTELSYAFSLSSDAAPQLARLADDPDQEPHLQIYLNHVVDDKVGWREFNFSQCRAKKFEEKLFQ